MSPQEYGILSLVNSLASFLLCFAGLQLALSLGRFYFDYDEKGVREFFSTILYAMLIANMVILIPIHYYGDGIASLVFPRAAIPYDPYVKLTVISVFLASFPPFFNLMLKVQERGATVLWTAVANTLAGVGFGVYFVVVREMGAHGFLLGTVSTAVVYNLILLSRVRSFIVPAFNVAKLRSALSYSIPIIPHTLGAVVFIYSDKLILGYFVPLAQIGLYNVADRIAMLLRLAVNAFHDANSPNFMRQSKESRAETVKTYRGLITRWAVVAAVAYLGLAFFSEELIMVMTPPRFHGSYRFIPILLGAYIFRGLYCFAINAVMYEKKTAVIPLMTLAAGVFNVVSNVLLIPVYGTIVAAWTTLVSYGLYFLTALYFSNRYYRLDFEWGRLFRIFGLMTAVFLCVYLLRGEALMLNAAMKAAGILIFAAVMAKWNYEDIVADTRQVFHHVLGRLVPARKDR